MRYERLSTAISKEKRGYLLIICALLLLCLSLAALAQSGRRNVKKESPPPTANVEAKTETEREKPKSDEGKVYTRELPQRSEWQLLAPAGEEFSILMPPLSDVYQGTRYMDLGFDRGQMVTVRIYRSLTAQALFVIHSYEASDLKHLVEDVVKSNKQLSFERDLKLNGFKGKSFSRKGLSIFSTVFGKGQYFITKKHLYIIEAARKDGDDPSLDQFLSSFNLGVSNPASKLNVESIPQSNTILNSKEVTRKAVILWRPTPTYKPEARRREERGRVSLKALLASNGIVTDIELRSGLGYGLTEQAIGAAKEIIFIPAEKEGEYVSQWVLIEYEFNLY